MAGMDGSSSWLSRPLRRRRLLQSGAALSGAAAFAAACGSGSKESTGSPSGQATSAAVSPSQAAAQNQQEQPKAGGTLREATVTQAPHFSPYHPGADPSFINTWRRVNGYYEPLWAFKTTKADEKTRLSLRLAASVEQPDDSTYIVKMHPSTFHNRPPANGRKVTAEDMVASMQFLSKAPASGGSFLQSGKDIKAMTAVDDLTVRFETQGPRAFFWENLARAPMPKELLDEETLKRTPPIGNGPYEYKGHQQGSTEEMKRFAGYYKKDRPYIDEKKLTIMPDNVASEAAFRSGQIDTIDSEQVQNVKQKESLVKDLGAKIVAHTFPSSSGMALVANISRDPFKDPRVREALYRAIDVDRVINVVFFGDARRTWYFSEARVDRNAVPFSQVKQFVDYDPKKAADLLKASGADLSKEYELMLPVENQSWVDSGRLMGEDLQKVGFKLKVNPVVRNIYLQRGGPKPGDFDLQMSVFLDWQYMKTKSGTFWDSTSLQDPEVDALVDKIETTIDSKSRDTLWTEVQLMLARKYSNMMPMLSGNVHYLWWSHVKGIAPDSAYGTPSGGWQDDRWLSKA